MSNRILPVLTAVLVVVLFVTGCASAPKRDLSRAVPSYVTLPNGHDPLNPDQLSPLFDPTNSGIVEGDITYYEKKRGHALNVLSLSGGGQNGAFGAGFLVGWRETGRRPEFDIVTGVSTGALLATHAFLGSPADDTVLEEMYTQVSKDDIYRRRGIVSLAFGAHSLRDTAPLQTLIGKYITPAVLDRVAAAYDDNRRIWIGTTNLDYDQTWVWNMTLIAKDGNLELYRKVLLASASFPIVFPPVEIDGHLLVDGAARSNLVLAGVAGKRRPEPPQYGPGNIYLIVNGKLVHAPEALRKGLGDIAATTIGVMMSSSMQSMLMRAYFAARSQGYNFKMAEIPEDITIGKDPLAFDPTHMRAAFDAGRALAEKPDPWSHVPPNLGDLPVWAMDIIEDGLR